MNDPRLKRLCDILSSELRPDEREVAELCLNVADDVFSLFQRGVEALEKLASTVNG